MGAYPSFRRTSLTFAVSAAVILSSLIALQPAAADTAPPVSSIPATASTTSLPTAQINGVVWDQIVIGDTVYAGGNFTKARPAGSAAGADEISRTYLLAYTLSTGVLTSFAPVLNGQVRALDVSPDGARLYAVGAFTTVNGVTRNRVVAFNTATGAVDTSFSGSANAEVYAITVNASAVYIGGQFSQVSGVARSGGAAAFNASTSAVLPWAPVLGSGRAFAMEVSPDASKVVIAGNFTTLNGNGSPGYGMGAVNTTSGASAPWAVGTVVRDAGTDAAVYNLDSDADNVYGSVYTFGTGGNLEGGWSANWSGAVNWVETCHGDTYSVAAIGNVVYYAGHTHSCDNSGGFPQTTPQTWHRGVAYTKQSVTTSDTGVMAKQPLPLMLNFYPTINAGTFTGQNQGPWSVAGNSNYVVYAGEFTQVNGKPQQGLARFPVASVGPNIDPPQLNGTAWPVMLTSYASGTMRVSWPSNWDRDNEKLTYTVSRNGANVYTSTARSQFWDQPTNTFLDTGLTPGASYTYKVTATDPFGNSAPSASVSGAVASSGTLSGYAKSIFSDSPTWYYRLGESSGSASNYAGPTANTTLTNAKIQALPATVGSGVTRSQAGAIAGDSNGSMTFNNGSSSRVYTTVPTWGDDSVSVEAWFKTTTASGKIVGFGSSANSDNSVTQDRSLYLNGGRVIWNVRDLAQQNIQSGTGYNDGKWHYAVGSVGPDGTALYVDGTLVASNPSVVKGWSYWGYWHIGGDASPAGNANFTGNIDEVAIYKTPLTAAQVANHYAAATGTTVTPPPANVAPNAAFSSSATNLAVSFNGAGSSDSDGSISAYAWNFGDATSGSGATVSHTYGAAGTYLATLTVTDNSGAIGVVSHSVTVTSGTVIPPPTGGTLASDIFGRTTSSGWGSADVGGAWTSTASANYVVRNGTGNFLIASATTRRAILGSVSSVRTDVTATVSGDKAATGGPYYAGLVGRQVGSDYYLARARFVAGGTVELQLLHGASTVLTSSVIPGLTVSAGSTLQLRVQVLGTNPTTVRAKVWAAEAAEPSTWQLSTTDSTAALQSAGSVGAESSLSSTATNAPVTISYDGFAATTVP